MCKHINDTITGPSRWWVGGGKVRDKYKVVCSPTGYSFTKPHSQLLNHSGSLQKDYIYGVLAPGTVQDWEKKGVIYLLSPSCFLSLLGRTSPNGTLKPAYPSRLCNPAAPGCRWGNQVLCPWSGASFETRHERAKAPVGETGHSWALELLWLPPQQTLRRPCQSPALTRGVLRQMAVLGDEVTEEAAGVFC